MQTMSTIYDVGMNNGDDTEYYLAKGHKVISIEANPELCRLAEDRFTQEIAEDRCVILNVGVADKAGFLDFYLNTEDHVTSTFVPQPNHHGRYRVIPTRVERLSNIIKKYGEPLYVKIDIEGMDFPVLRELFLAGVCPLNISAEAHKLDVFCMLVSMGYDQFKIVDSPRVSEEFAQHPIRQLNGDIVPFDFKHNSSGPFGEDLPGHWLPAQQIVEKLLARQDTWQDMHARNARAIYQKEAEMSGSPAAFEEIELAYKYWQRYPDVAQDSVWGELGEFGIRGAKEHFDRHGRYEEDRNWG